MQNLSGSCPSLVFEVERKTVYTTPSTEYDDGRCKDVKKNKKIEIKGTLMSDGRVRANEVEVDD